MGKSEKQAKKDEIAHRLLAGEDVEIKLESEKGLKTGESGPSKTGIEELAEGHASSERVVQEEQHEHSIPQQSNEIPSELVIEVMSGKIAMLSRDLSISEARCIMLESQIQDLHRIIAHLQEK